MEGLEVVSLGGVGHGELSEVFFGLTGILTKIMKGGVCQSLVYCFPLWLYG